MALELLAFVVVAALALPGIRTAAEIEAAAAAVTATAGGPERTTARRRGEAARTSEDAGVEREAVLVGAAGTRQPGR